jgi:hypothetical protein
MAPHRNWSAVGGLLLCVAGVVSYFALVVTHNPRLRWLLDTPLLNLVAVAVGICLTFVGARQAARRTHRGRILAPISAALSVGVGSFFVWFLFVETAKMPEGARAPGVGMTAPDFALRDQSNNEVQLSSLRGHPLVLLFYRGFW